MRSGSSLEMTEMVRNGLGKISLGEEERVSLRGFVDGAFVRTEDAAKIEVEDAERLVRLRDSE